METEEILNAIASNLESLNQDPSLISEKTTAFEEEIWVVEGNIKVPSPTNITEPYFPTIGSKIEFYRPQLGKLAMKVQTNSKMEELVFKPLTEHILVSEPLQLDSDGKQFVRVVSLVISLLGTKYMFSIPTFELSSLEESSTVPKLSASLWRCKPE